MSECQFGAWDLPSVLTFEDGKLLGEPGDAASSPARRPAPTPPVPCIAACRLPDGPPER